MKTNARIRKNAQTGSNAKQSQDSIPHESGQLQTPKADYASMKKEVKKIADPVGMEFLKAFYGISK